MVRHVVMFNFKDGVTDAQIGAYAAAIRNLPSVIPQIRDYRLGPDLGVNPGNFAMVVCGDFASVDDYIAYRDHPEHQRVIKEIGLPIIAQRAAVQFEY
ncbi:MAG: hypothetical protein RL219_2303 [Actinomycetota bacterium]|jgi:hypothetical protein